MVAVVPPRKDGADAGLEAAGRQGFRLKVSPWGSDGGAVCCACSPLSWRTRRARERRGEWDIECAEEQREVEDVRVQIGGGRWRC